MRIACFGDVVGETGVLAVVKYVQENKAKLKFDFVIVNGENSAKGFGINKSICDMFFASGVDVITLGNHTFDRKADMQLIEREKNLIRPINYSKGTPGHGCTVVSNPSTGKKILVINALGRVFMELNDDPFSVVEECLKRHSMGHDVDAIFIDFHAQATAEKAAFARYFDGVVSGVFGTHTHIPTADAQILPRGTGFLSDCGMCGDYNSIIGFESATAIKRFTKKVDAFAKISPASSEATVCGVVMDVDGAGLCSGISTIRVGGCLKEKTEA